MKRIMQRVVVSIVLTTVFFLSQIIYSYAEEIELTEVSVDEVSTIDDNSTINEAETSVSNNIDNSDEFEETDNSEEDFSEEKNEVEVEEDFPLVDVDNYLSYGETWSDSNEEYTYEFEIDYSNMEKATVCLVRTGLVNSAITIFDENGNKLYNVETSTNYGRKWVNLTNNSEEAIERYTIKVKPVDYSKRKTASFKLMIGNQVDAEKMMSGMENAVELDKYYEPYLNFVRNEYLPNNYECFYKVTNSSSSILTILFKTDDIRFRVYDSNGVLLQDSNNPNLTESIHRTDFVGHSWKCAEKEDLTHVFNGSGPYYIGLYNLKPSNENTLIKDYYLIAYGDPMMCSGSTTVMPWNTININSQRYVQTSFDVTDSSIPTTAKATKITYSGAVGSSIQYWRVMSPDESSWTSSKSYEPGINIYYSHGSLFNSSVHGRWNVSFLASKTSRINTISPYYTIYYYYEYGD